MKKEMGVEAVLNMFKSLSETEQVALADRIMQMMIAPGQSSEHRKKAPKDLCKDLGVYKENNKPDCPHCAAKAELGFVIKRGMNKGTQRYYCKSCGKYFVATTNTAFARTRKDADTWRKFIRMTIAGKSLVECEEDCSIAHLTAFTWRHKVLNAFVVNQAKTQMTGTVEVDEMLIPLSYKGNHIQGGFGGRKLHPKSINDMPRKGYKRGTDNISRSPKEKACVFCMVENGNKNFFAAVPGSGFMSKDMLDATLAKHVDKEKALVLADEYKATKGYFERNGYKHTILRSNVSDNPKDHKPEVQNGLHLQHVNSMHQHIRKFLKPYYGVSSKYLAHYIALFVWLKSVAIVKQKKSVEKVSVIRAATPDCYISRKELDSRPIVPMCA